MAFQDTGVLRALEKVSSLLRYMDSYKPSKILVSKMGKGVGLKRSKSTVPTSTRSQESCVLETTITDGWNAIKDCNFAFSREVLKSDGSDNLRRICYRDGTVQTIDIREVSGLHHFITYEVISSEPSVDYTSAIHRIRLHRVTACDEKQLSVKCVTNLIKITIKTHKSK